MDVWKAALPCQRCEQIVQGCALAFVESGGDFALVLTGERPWHVVTLGLLIAGIAVPGLIVGLLPRPVAWTGLVIAGHAELTTLVLIWTALSPLLPVARFTGLIWLIVAGALLPLRRRNKQDERKRGWVHSETVRQPDELLVARPGYRSARGDRGRPHPNSLGTIREQT